jgi:RNA polymerase sigma-70 factor (ECF subfamily)
VVCHVENAWFLLISSGVAVAMAQLMTTDDGLSSFLNVRPRLFGIAYRMLGRAAEAEDLVQDVWVRWQTTDRSLVRDAAAFLATTTTRLAINVLQSARSRRETYAGSALRMLLENLTPNERAAYILREAFDYRYRDIAEVLQLEEANARQVVTRARQHIVKGPRMPATALEHSRLLGAFVAAFQNGDITALECILGG